MVKKRRIASKKAKTQPKPSPEQVLRDQRILIFVPEHNAKGKKDVTGAFLPEAQKLLKLASSQVHRFGADGGWVGTEGSRIVAFDNHLPMSRRRRFVLETMNGLVQSGEIFTSVAFFCHGWASGIQAGFTRSSVRSLAMQIYALTGESSVVPVPLFCCSTGEHKDDKLTSPGTGDDSFADKLRDELCAQGATLCRVMAHTTVAHATSNPMVLFMDGMGTPDGGVGGYPPVSPKSKNWVPWKRALRDRRNNTLRLRMPYMQVADIHTELGRK